MKIENATHEVVISYNAKSAYCPRLDLTQGYTLAEITRFLKLGNDFHLVSLNQPRVDITKQRSLQSQLGSPIRRYISPYNL